MRVGSLASSSQWTIEHTIGHFGEEIKQHSSPYANTSQRGIRRCQVNTLKAMIPDLRVDEESNSSPRGAYMIHEETVGGSSRIKMALIVRDRNKSRVSTLERDAIESYTRRVSDSRLLG
jgi:hypothetical protein